MLKFKKHRYCDSLVAENNKYIIEKDLETNEYCLYINESLHSVSKTLKTAKKDANEHFNENI